MRIEQMLKQGFKIALDYVLAFRLRNQIKKPSFRLKLYHLIVFAELSKTDFLKLVSNVGGGMCPLHSIFEH